jgi:copper homeostasis protein
MVESRPQKVLLELCIASVEDGITAQSGGASRLELCSALSLGGLTPSLGTLGELKRVVRLPVMVLIRPRTAGFCYSASEFRVMQRDIDLMLENGADGIVFGVLDQDGSVDRERSAQIVRQVGRLDVVFNRAFDVTPDPLTAMEQLIDLGVKRILTSGQQPTALAGATTIAELIQRSTGRVEILPAGGINAATFPELLKRCKCSQVHASLRTVREDRSTAARPQITFGGTGIFQEGLFEVTDGAAVAKLAAMM